MAAGDGSAADSSYDNSLTVRDGTIDICMQGRNLDDKGAEKWCAWARENVPAFIQKNNIQRRADDGWVAARQLDFSNNALGDVGVLAILRVLHSLHIGVRVIKLYKNNLGRAAACALMDFLGAIPVAALELHLSHNYIPREGAVDILKAVAYNLHYPPEKPGRGRVPLWLRLEQNIVASPEELIATAEMQMKKIRAQCGGASSTTGPMLCYLRDPTSNCCRSDYCVLITPEHCPLAQVTYLASQRTNVKVPPEAQAWHAFREQREESARWRMTPRPTPQPVARSAPAVPVWGNLPGKAVVEASEGDASPGGGATRPAVPTEPPPSGPPPNPPPAEPVPCPCAIDPPVVLPDVDSDPEDAWPIVDGLLQVSSGNPQAAPLEVKAPPPGVKRRVRQPDELKGTGEVVKQAAGGPEDCNFGAPVGNLREVPPSMPPPAAPVSAASAMTGAGDTSTAAANGVLSRAMREAPITKAGAPIPKANFELYRLKNQLEEALEGHPPQAQAGLVASPTNASLNKAPPAKGPPAVKAPPAEKPPAPTTSPHAKAIMAMELAPLRRPAEPEADVVAALPRNFQEQTVGNGLPPDPSILQVVKGNAHSGESSNTNTQMPRSGIEAAEDLPSHPNSAPGNLPGIMGFGGVGGNAGVWKPQILKRGDGGAPGMGGGGPNVAPGGASASPIVYQSAPPLAGGAGAFGASSSMGARPEAPAYQGGSGIAGNIIGGNGGPPVAPSGPSSLKGEEMNLAFKTPEEQTNHLKQFLGLTGGGPPNDGEANRPRTPAPLPAPPEHPRGLSGFGAGPSSSSQYPPAAMRAPWEQPPDAFGVAGPGAAAMHRRKSILNASAPEWKPPEHVVAALSAERSTLVYAESKAAAAAQAGVAVAAKQEPSHPPPYASGSSAMPGQMHGGFFRPGMGPGPLMGEYQAPGRSWDVDPSLGMVGPVLDPEFDAEAPLLGTAPAARAFFAPTPVRPHRAMGGSAPGPPIGTRDLSMPGFEAQRMGLNASPYPAQPEPVRPWNDSGAQSNTAHRAEASHDLGIGADDSQEFYSDEDEVSGHFSDVESGVSNQVSSHAVDIVGAGPPSDAAPRLQGEEDADSAAVGAEEEERGIGLSPSSPLSGPSCAPSTVSAMLPPPPDQAPPGPSGAEDGVNGIATGEATNAAVSAPPLEPPPQAPGVVEDDVQELDLTEDHSKEALQKEILRQRETISALRKDLREAISVISVLQQEVSRQGEKIRVLEEALERSEEENRSLKQRL